MALDRFHAWCGGLCFVQGNGMLRLLPTVLVFSCVIILILTGLQLRRDCNRGQAQIESRLADIDRSNRDRLGEALWQLDQPQLKLELEGMLRLLAIRAAEVSEWPASPSAVVVSAGERMSGMTVTRQFPILYHVHDRVQRNGTLYVEPTLSNLYHDLARTALVILVSQAASTSLVALFIFFILARLATRHLAAIARRVSGYDSCEPPATFVPQRKPPREPEEFDGVVSAINGMGMRLHREYLDEREAADEREARRSSEEANRAKGEYLANLSHELRTPLNGVLGYALILERDAASNNRQSGGVAAIQQCGEHLLTVNDEMLDFPRVEAGKLRFEICDAQLAGIVDSIRGIIGIKAHELDLVFECVVLPGTHAGVSADERRLRQVLLNLLSNAVKFTDRGSVRLAIMCGGSGAVRFEVCDTGIGIAAEHLEGIFMPFEQAGGAARRKGGTGLGLAITRQFVRAMGGDGYVENSAGEGSIFWFQLPAASQPAAPALAHATASRISGYAGPRVTMLLIDNVQVNRAVAIDVLARAGFVHVESGLDGIALAASRRPDIILTDIVMPGIGGLVVTRRLRAMPGFEHIPVIAISASPPDSHGARCVDAGVNALLSKPVDLLLAQIGELLGLTWIHEIADDATRIMPADPSAAIPATVSADAMNELHKLARDGNMTGVVQWATGIVDIDPLNAAFAARLQQLARAYHTKAILQLVECHLDARVAS